MKSDIIRVGDRVRIVNPEMFVRCGYPLSWNDAELAVSKQYCHMIYEFLANTGLYVGVDIYHIENDIKHAFAKRWLQSRGYGGNVRSIYTEYDEFQKDRTFTVYEIRYVRSGVYRPGYISGYEEPEYNPAYLDKIKTHKILNDTIEAVHVEKIND
jgi:hypothetical protein